MTAADSAILDDEWQKRLLEMEDWYRQFLGDGEGLAETALLNDYAAHSNWLGQLRGKVLDVGGGAGLAGRHLDLSVDYTVLDPSPVWDEPEWKVLSKRFRGDRATCFVRGTGEAMPFKDGQFDTALAFWSLNHAKSPATCLAEMARVVRPGGNALLVLEDMRPGWCDLVLRAWEGMRARVGGKSVARYWNQPEVGGLLATLRHVLSGQPWPLQNDHVRIEEGDLRRWLSQGFSVKRRNWRGGYLTFELNRRNLAFEN